MRSEKYLQDTVLKKQQPNINPLIFSKSILKIEEKSNSNLYSYPQQQAKTQSGTKTRFVQVNSKRQSAKYSTAKYREKKKRQLEQLEQNVKQLENQIQQTDKQVQNVKQNILTALQSLTKMSQRVANENVEIFNELESLIGKSDHNKNQQQIINYEVDFDKINLLLDTLKYRIGANGRQRQSKLAYQFKSIVNTLFPALYRYVLLTCIHKIDLFRQKGQENKSSNWQWTNQLLKKLDFDQKQLQEMGRFGNRLNNVFEQTIQGVKRLNSIKGRLKRECEEVQTVQQQYREYLTPIQCAYWIIFAQKHKYRKQVMLENKFQPMRTMKSEQLDQVIQRNMMGRKRVKLTHEQKDC